MPPITPNNETLGPLRPSAPAAPTGARTAEGVELFPNAVHGMVVIFDFKSDSTTGQWEVGADDLSQGYPCLSLRTVFNTVESGAVPTATLVIPRGVVLGEGPDAVYPAVRDTDQFRLLSDEAEKFNGIGIRVYATINGVVSGGEPDPTTKTYLLWDGAISSISPTGSGADEALTISSIHWTGSLSVLSAFPSPLRVHDAADVLRELTLGGPGGSTTGPASTSWASLAGAIFGDPQYDKEKLLPPSPDGTTLDLQNIFVNWWLVHAAAAARAVTTTPTLPQLFVKSGRTTGAALLDTEVREHLTKSREVFAPLFGLPAPARSIGDTSKVYTAVGGASAPSSYQSSTSGGAMASSTSPRIKTDSPSRALTAHTAISTSSAFASGLSRGLVQELNEFAQRYGFILVPGVSTLVATVPTTFPVKQVCRDLGDTIISANFSRDSLLEATKGILIIGKASSPPSTTSDRGNLGPSGDKPSSVLYTEPNARGTIIQVPAPVALSSPAGTATASDGLAQFNEVNGDAVTARRMAYAQAIFNRRRLCHSSMAIVTPIRLDVTPGMCVAFTYKSKRWFGYVAEVVTSISDRLETTLQLEAVRQAPTEDEEIPETGFDSSPWYGMPLAVPVQ